MELAHLIIEALKFIFPAYCANGIPVIFGGGIPLDFGKKFFDGKPIFGKNKTFRGFFSGLVVGTAIGFVESAFFNYPSIERVEFVNAGQGSYRTVLTLSDMRDSPEIDSE